MVVIYVADMEGTGHMHINVIIMSEDSAVYHYNAGVKVHIRQEVHSWCNWRLGVLVKDIISCCEEAIRSPTDLLSSVMLMSHNIVYV